MFPAIYFYFYSYVQIKCLKYWPSASPEMYGPVLVSPGDEEELADYVVRKFTIQMVSLVSIFVFSLFQWFSSGHQSRPTNFLKNLPNKNRGG